MEPKQFKIGTKFTYEGINYPYHRGLVQKVIKLTPGRVHTDKHSFHPASIYAGDCELAPLWKKILNYLFKKP